MKFVIDMNLSVAWAELLRSEGHDAVHWQNLGPRAARDEAILARAAADDRIVLTADLDFGEAVVRRKLTAPTIVQLRCGSTDPDVVGNKVLAAVREANSELLSGCIMTIENDRVRMRRGLQTISPTGETHG